MIFTPCDDLINESGANIRLVEVFSGAPPGRHGCVIPLPPGCRRQFPAHKFSDRNLYSGRASTIRVYVDGAEAPSSLKPDHFKRYIRLIFRDAGDGRLAVRGVEAKFSDHLQIWGWRCFGRSHVGRTETTLIRNLYEHPLR